MSHSKNNQNSNTNLNQPFMPTFDFGQTLGEVFGEALVKFARWALEEEDRRWSDDYDDDDDDNGREGSDCRKDSNESVERESESENGDEGRDGEEECPRGREKGLRNSNVDCKVNVGCDKEKKDGGEVDDVVVDDTKAFNADNNDVNTTEPERKNLDVHRLSLTSQALPDTQPQDSLVLHHHSLYSGIINEQDGAEDEDEEFIIYTPDESDLDLDEYDDLNGFEDLGDLKSILDRDTRSRNSSTLSLVEVGVDVGLVNVGLDQSLQHHLQQSSLNEDKEKKEEGKEGVELPVEIVTTTKLNDYPPSRDLNPVVAYLEKEEDPVTTEMNVFTQEGVEVARRIWEHFWSEEHKHFRTDGRTAETIGDWNGYTCWAYLIGLEAILEAERSSPGTFQNEIEKALYGMEKFWSPDHGAYCAWIWFKGNGDIYIDDNAQVAILLLLAHKLLPPPPVGFPYRSYAERAEQVVRFCLTGWDEVNGGGVRWHVSTEGPPWTNRNACSTSLTAVAALELASVLREGGIPNEHPRVRELVDWGRRCVDWVWAELVVGNGSGLVLDGVVQKQKGGPWVKEGPTYTYNTGHTITALVLLYDLLLPGDPYAPTVHLRATSLVISSIDQTKTLYDTTVPTLQHRYWWDNNFFVHLLVEGLVSWGLRFGSEEPQLWQQVRAELHREMTYAMMNLRDRDDGLYWRNFRLYTISMGHLRLYKSITGDESREPRLDGAERKQDDKSMQVPVGNRGMVKTLLGCGGAGRALCIAGRVV